MRNFATPEWKAYFQKWARRRGKGAHKVMEPDVYRRFTVFKILVNNTESGLLRTCATKHGRALYNGRGGLIKGACRRRRGRTSVLSRESNVFSKSETLRLLRKTRKHVRAKPELFGARNGSKQEIQKRVRTAFAEVSSRDRHVKLRRLKYATVDECPRQM